MPTLQIETARLNFAPKSYDPAANTIEAVISTGADVIRRDAKGTYVERLDITQVDAAALADRPVVNGHKTDGTEHLVGVIQSARLDLTKAVPELIAVIRLSAADDVRSVVLKITEGIIRSVSIGYPPLAGSWTKGPNGVRILTGVPNIAEVSFVVMGADPGARTRSHEMPPEQITVDTTEPARMSRADYCAYVRSTGATAGLPQSWVDTQIDAEEADINTVNAAALAALQARSATVGSIRSQVLVDNTEPTLIIARQAEALAQRMGGPAASEPAQQYLGQGFADFARQALVRAGQNVNYSESGADLITRAMQTTSDLGLLMDQGANRVLSNAYQGAENPLKALAVRRPVQDLTDVTVIGLGEGSGLEEVNEAGEVKSGSFGAKGETYSMVQLAKKYAFSDRLIKNDQFGALGDMMGKLGRLAATAEANALYAKLIGAAGLGPVMSDGKTLIHADHANRGTATIPDTDGLTEARKFLRSQKDIDGVTPAGVTPKYLVVGPELETFGEQMLTALNAAPTASDQNVFAGKLTLVVEPRITDASWYVFGDQVSAPVLEIAYLASAPGPQIRARDGWDTLGREYRVTLDIGVGAVDHRGVYRNAGAA